MISDYNLINKEKSHELEIKFTCVDNEYGIGRVRVSVCPFAYFDITKQCQSGNYEAKDIKIFQVLEWGKESIINGEIYVNED